MRGLLMCGVAMIMIGPSAVADATADRAVRDLIKRPQVCGPPAGRTKAHRSPRW